VPSENEVFAECHKGLDPSNLDELLSVGQRSFGEVLTFFRVCTIVLSLTCIAGFFAGAIRSKDGETSWRGHQLEKGTYRLNGLVC
jgi:hypothetical protein